MSIMEKKPKSLIAESYRSLRSNIAYSSFDGEYQIISVTSAVPAEGKSTTAINLAVSLSQLEKKVLLIDCDMRKPSLHKKLGISNVYGLTDLLVEKRGMKIVSQKKSDQRPDRPGNEWRNGSRKPQPDPGGLGRGGTGL